MIEVLEQYEDFEEYRKALHGLQLAYSVGIISRLRPNQEELIITYVEEN